jgi:uncharacterized protein YjbI with pentapeptide repeats
MSESNLNTFITAVAFLLPLGILAINWILEYTGLKSNKRKREEATLSFNKIVENLSSDNPSAQLSAAILLRRFLQMKIGKTNYLRTETIGVISAILRTLPTGVYQKTLADGLAYASDLTSADLQRTNLQNIYLGSKTERICLHHTDLFKSNLAYGLIDNVDAVDIILYQAFLQGARIKNSNFQGADFRGADLTNLTMVNVILTGAKFAGASHIPDDIQKHLSEEGIYELTVPANVNSNSAKRVVFFSMPGNMAKDDEVTVSAYRDYMISNNFEVIYYNRDTYPRSGQLAEIKLSIERSSALIAFGTKQTHIKEGTYRPGMEGENPINDGWLSTPWNDVEVGMAVMAGLPILLIKDDRIKDGVFDQVISEEFVFTLSSKTDIKELESNKVFKDWFSKIPQPTV